MWALAISFVVLLMAEGGLRGYWAFNQPVSGAAVHGGPRLMRDWRNIRTGCEISSEGYCDQPYIVITKDGNWLCTMTTGADREGQGDQHVVSTISADHGKTWTPPVDIEPADGPEASWVMPLMTPSGRVYAFYTYNGDNIRSLGEQDNIRADTLGWYCYRYSDDNGQTWSADRYRLPLRVTAVDRGNDWHGEVQIFWGIGKPITFNGRAMFAFTKIGKYMLDESEGWFFRSDNILTESDPAKIQWELLPEGDHGLRNAEFGSIQSEQNIVPMRDGGVYCMYRTTTGYPCHAYSRDGGRTWTLPEQATYAPGGKRMKNPRACPRIWRTQNGKYLFWFHNHSGKDFLGRNPAWISGGVEKDGHIHWSQPEILLYDPQAGDEIGRGGVRMSYPDLVEQDGRYWISETQKSVARVHEIDKTLLEGLWNQGNAKHVAREGLLLELGTDDARDGVAMPRLPDLRDLGGFSLDCWIELDDLAPGQALLDARTGNDKGIALLTAQNGAVKLELADGTTSAAWTSDEASLTPAKPHHVVVVVDSGPKIITFIVDGVLCDGGEQRQFGWGRFPAALGDVNGAETLEVAGAVKHLRVYGRHLRTSEAVANYHAGNEDKGLQPLVREAVATPCLNLLLTGTARQEERDAK